MWSDEYHFVKFGLRGGTAMKKRKKTSKLLFWEAIGYLFSASALLLLIGLLFIPMIQGFRRFSVTDFNVLKSWDYNFYRSG